MSTTEYRWRPLDKARQEIRVLDLEPGTGDAPLSGQLRHVFLDESDKPDYETISYAWVDTDLVANMSVNDQNIPIPASAGSALRCMRSLDRTRTLWIDCICIDQNNDHEKGHQVGLIADIFQNSRETLAHLSDVDDTAAEHATIGIAVISMALLKSTEDKTLPEGTWRVGKRKIENWSSLREKLDLGAIKAIMLKPYFARLWIVQEVVLSAKTTLYYGAQFIRMTTFVLAATWLLSSPQAFRYEADAEDLKQASSCLRIMEAMLRVWPANLSLGDLLYQGIWLQCSEPRDRVFGILGLTRLATRQCPIVMNLAPDYTKPVAEVYYEATRACIVECDPPFLLDSFGYERDEDHTIEELPTWVPNWYYGKYRLISGGRATPLPEHANLWADQPHSKDTCLVPGPSAGKVLSIRGVVLEAIAECPKAVDMLDDHGRLEFMSGACKLLSNETKDASTGLEQFDRLYHVLGAGCHDATVIRRCMEFLGFYPSEDHVMSEGSDLTTHSTKLSTRIQTNGPDSSLRRAQGITVDDLKSSVEATMYCFHRRVFKTRSGLLGIGPKALQNGDVIIVSRLSQLPMVIRRAVDSGPDHYNVIDNAFVEGMRNGEEIFAAAAERNAMETIHLI